MKRRSIIVLMAMASITLIFDCYATITNQNNTLTKKEKAEGWKLLFDGHSTAGWHIYNSTAPFTVWKVKDGELICDPKDRSEPGDLVTDGEYKDFDLKLEWKIPKEGNSGVFIDVQEKKDLATGWMSGPEYQLLGNSNPDFAKPKSRSGCLFGIDAQKNAAKIVAENDWNRSEIRQQNGKVKFYLNGTLTVEEDFNSSAWTQKVAASTFKRFAEYGKHTSGHLALQDWSTGIAFRNIKIKEL